MQYTLKKYVQAILLFQSTWKQTTPLQQTAGERWKHIIYEMENHYS